MNRTTDVTERSASTGSKDRTGSTEARAFPAEQLVKERVPRGRSTNPLIWLAPIFFGAIWAVDAYFKWQPAFQRHFVGLIQSGATNQPGWLHSWYQFWSTSLAPHPAAYAYGVAVIETIIAAAMILGFARKLLYICGAIYSLGVWAVPEGFGNIQRAASTDLGPSIAYVAVFVALLALDSCAGTRPFSLDALIERGFPGWRHVAEVRS
jgi:nitrite reductase (NO-forming)